MARRSSRRSTATAPGGGPARAGNRVRRVRVPALLAAGALLVVGFAVATAVAPVGHHLPPGPREGIVFDQNRGHGLVVAAPPVVTVAAAPKAKVPATGWIATLRGPLGWSASPGGAVRAVLAARNPFGEATVLAVVGRPRPDGWARVELPVRPNGTTGWIRWHLVRLARTPYRIVVHTATHRLVLLDGARTVLEAPAAVGAPATPTPSGATYVWEFVRLDDPTGPYGPYILGLGMFSDAYAVFNGGDAQIGIHGNDDPASVGQPVSHGCVRLTNPLISRLVDTVPLGTPVTVEA